MTCSISSGQSEVGRLGTGEGRQQRLEHLHTQARDLRVRLATVKESYEAGRLSLDEEIALVRGIEREMVAVGNEIHGLSAKHC